MRKKASVLLLLCCLLVSFAGCAKRAAGKGDGSTGSGKEQAVDEAQTTQTGNGALETGSKEAGETAPAREGEERYVFEEMSVLIPGDWAGKVEIVETKDGFYFVQKASREINEELGFMCGFFRYDSLQDESMGAEMIAYTKDTLYYFQQPTDFPCAEEPAVIEEYQELMQKIRQVADSFLADREDVGYDAGEYVVPASDTMEIPEDILVNTYRFDLWIARNEIYARHGRKFDNRYLQSYFDTCSWYKGTVEAEDFDEGSLNDVELANLDRIKEAEAELLNAASPYPVKYAPKQQVWEDLDEDGKKEKISLFFKDTEQEDMPQAFLTIDGTEYDLEKLGAFLVTANTDAYYITDLKEKDDRLEIAVMDYGPSSDPVTHFFAYADGTLSYMGGISGFPFKENLGFDGFAYYPDGRVVSTLRVDLICTAYAYAFWEYDEDAGKMVLQKDADYEMVSDGAHELLLDLPLYASRDEEADTLVMKAQKEVFFVQTDAKEWIKLKAKDGTQGYMHCSPDNIDLVDLPPTEVFGNLQFYD